MEKFLQIIQYIVPYFYRFFLEKHVLYSMHFVVISLRLLIRHDCFTMPIFCLGQLKIVQCVSGFKSSEPLSPDERSEFNSAELSSNLPETLCAIDL